MQKVKSSIINIILLMLGIGIIINDLKFQMKENQKKTKKL